MGSVPGQGTKTPPAPPPAPPPPKKKKKFYLLKAAMALWRTPFREGEVCVCVLHVLTHACTGMPALLFHEMTSLIPVP